MDVTPLNPADAAELAELRRLAYGTTEGLSNPDALARLEELERAAHSARSEADVLADPATIAPRDDPDPIVTLPPSPTPAHPPSPTPEEGATAPAQNPRRVRTLGTIVIAAVVGGFATAVALFVLGVPGTDAAAAPSPTPTPAAELPAIPLAGPMAVATLPPDIERTRRGLFGSADWASLAGFDTATLEAYQRIGTITPWTANKRDYDARCLLLITEEGRIFSHMGCAGPGELPTLGLVVTKDSAFSVGSRLPVGSAVLFVDTGSGIEVQTATP